MRPTDEGARRRRWWEARAGQQASQALEQVHSAPGDRQLAWLGQGSGEHGEATGSVGAAVGAGSCRPHFTELPGSFFTQGTSRAWLVRVQGPKRASGREP